MKYAQKKFIAGLMQNDTTFQQFQHIRRNGDVDKNTQVNEKAMELEEKVNNLSKF